MADFHEYCLHTTKDQYDYIASIVDLQQARFFREEIEKTIKTYHEREIPQLDRVNDMQRALILAIYSPSVDIGEPKDGDKYSDEEIAKIIEKVNAYLMRNPISGIKKLAVIGKQRRKQITDDGTLTVEKEKEISRDNQIATHFAIEYLTTLSDYQMIELAKSLGKLTKREEEILTAPYTGEKETAYEGPSAQETKKDYNDANAANLGGSGDEEIEVEFFD